MLHKILTSCMLKSTQGMIVTFLVVMNKSIPPKIFFQLLSRFPLTCAKIQYTIIVVLVWLSW